MTVQILKGDCREILRTLPAESVHCVVTSPPYFGLRDYGTAKWDGGDPDCAHLVAATGSTQNKGNNGKFGMPFRNVCGVCGASRVDRQIGLEPTPEAFVAELVAVFRGVRRVLRSDGVFWLNLGDSYAANRGYQVSQTKHQAHDYGNSNATTVPAGLKPKDLIGIPWRVAFALQADGWYLRQDIIWSKPNPMPESVRDRCTKAHEYLFLLSKSATYYYDADAIKEEGAGRTDLGKMKFCGRLGGDTGWHDDGGEKDELGRNKRSVWEVATSPFGEAHFATFPPALIEPCILAGCPEFTCSKCGTVLDKSIKDAIRSSTNGSKKKDQTDSSLRMVRETGDSGSPGPAETILQQGVRFETYGEDPLHIEGALHDLEGICSDLQAEPPECVEGRLRDGTSLGDGSEPRSATAAERNRTPQKRRAAREQRDELGSPVQDGTRQAAKNKDRQGALPTLRRIDPSVPTCPRCEADLTRIGAIVPGTVLDCFGGAGTTGMVADRLGRNAILIELNPEYADMAERRIRGDAGMFAEVLAP